MRQLALRSVWLIFLFASTLISTAMGVNAQTQPSASDRALKTELLKLRAQDDYIQQIGWQLTTANAPSCANARPAIGLLLQDAQSYPNASAVRRALGTNGDFTIQSVAAGSPAEQAGLVPGAEIVAIDGIDLSSFTLDQSENWRRILDVGRFLEQSLARDGVVQLTLRNQLSPVSLEGAPACPGRFELLTGHDAASANAERVAIGAEFVGLSYPEEEFAAVLAHELAHILLRHPQWLDAAGRKRRNIRVTEREADRLMPWLLANAGFDPEAAGRFMRRWGPGNGGGLFRKRTHDRWDERVEFIEAEYPLIKEAQIAGGYADWRSRFPVRQHSE